jgi:hypothetical protein
VSGELQLEVAALVTTRVALDALESRYPMLRGTIPGQSTGERWPFLRVFACKEDLSHTSLVGTLPDALATGKEPLLMIGAIAGG